MTNTQTAYLDFDAGDGSLYEHGEDGQTTHLFTADPECELETFEEFTAKAQKIVDAVNYHDDLLEALVKAESLIKFINGTAEIQPAHEYVNNVWNEARAAIAKARGEQ